MVEGYVVSGGGMSLVVACHWWWHVIGAAGHLWL